MTLPSGRTSTGSVPLAEAASVPRQHLWHRFEVVIYGEIGSRRSDERTKMRPSLSKSKLPAKRPAEQVVKDIRRATRRRFSAEDKIRIVLDGLRGDDSIAELCREASALKECVADLTLENRLLKKSMIDDGGD